MQVEGLSAVLPKTLTPDFPIPGKYRLTCEGNCVSPQPLPSCRIPDTVCFRSRTLNLPVNGTLTSRCHSERPTTGFSLRLSFLTDTVSIHAWTTTCICYLISPFAYISHPRTHIFIRHGSPLRPSYKNITSNAPVNGFPMLNNHTHLPVVHTPEYRSSGMFSLPEDVWLSPVSAPLPAYCSLLF